MATAASIGKNLLAIVLPKGKSNPEGTAVTQTFNPSSPNTVLTTPTYREHLTDLFSSRSSSDSKTLIQSLFREDPDMSASVNAFLTVSDTEPVFLVKNADQSLDPTGQTLLNQLITKMTVRSDYSTGFEMPRALSNLTEAARYMLLLRGGVAAELVISKELFPTEMRMIDLGSIEWTEPKPGKYKPQQSTSSGQKISLDIPSFHVSWFRRDPTGIYSYSPFVSAINTIAARQQVVNDLYRIMKITGYPRMEAKILEEVILKNAPSDVRQDPSKKQQYVNTIITGLQNTLSSLRPDQTFVHTDSIEVGIINEKAAGMTLNIDSIINTLNAQNQAALKTMATIIGRGESGVNTASVEARIFSLSAQAINEPIAELLSYLLTLALRLNGSASYVECYFMPVEMRSATELATQRLVEAQMLKEDLSLGIITDVEYHLRVYNRLPPAGAPVLSGTNFKTSAAGVDTTAISPNGDPVGRAASAPRGNAGARDNKSKVKSAK